MEAEKTVATRTLTDIIQEVRNDVSSNSGETVNYSGSLSKILKKYRYFPSLQVKKFFGNEHLVLLHNTYRRYDVKHFQKLYDECRSVVLDFSADDGKNVVVTYTNSIPVRMSFEAYLADSSESDKIETSYEGTVITIYNYMGSWYFGTTSCPKIDSSRYFHPTKTHGMMFDEAISRICGVVAPENKEESTALRAKFCEEYLDVSKAYAFILVHHENKHIMDYSSIFGDEYAKLVHITMRDRETYVDMDLSSSPLANAGVVYPAEMRSIAEATEFLNNDITAYAIMVKRSDGTLIKVSKENIISKEEKHLGHPNQWYNMIYVYMQNKPQYKILDYVKEYDVKYTVPLNSRGVELDPTYVIHTSICTIRDVLYYLYKSTTDYNVTTKRYTINRDADGLLAPIIRFHLVQLRNIQVTSHRNYPLTDKAVYHYICHHQTMKNTRLLIKYFATSWINGNYGNGIPPRAADCIKVLNVALTDTRNNVDAPPELEEIPMDE